MSTIAPTRPNPAGRSHRWPRRSALVGAVGAAALTVVLGAPHAQALESQVCLKWSSHISSYIDPDGVDTTVIEGRCDFWMSTGGDPDGGSKTEPGTPPKGPDGVVDDTDKDYCDVVRAELASTRSALDWALAHQQAAQDAVDALTYLSASAHLTYVAARDAYLRAEATLDHVLAMYASENDTSSEREVKSGVTITRSLPVNVFAPWGEEVVAAQKQLVSARAEMDTAWAKWSGQTDPDLREAQQLLDALDQTIATAPGRIESLQRELHDRC